MATMSRDYGHGSFGGPRGGSYDPPFGMEGGGRFGPYESYDSRSSMGGRDLYRSGYEFSEPEQSRFGGSYGDRYDNSYRQSVDSFGGRNQGGSSWDSSFSRSNMRPGAFDDGGRDSYSSFGNFPSPHMKPAPVGSRGRGPSAFPESAFGGRNFDALGGPPAGRGRGRGSMGYPSSMRARGIVVDYKNRGPQPLVGRGGIKRKFGPAAVAAGKKTKLSQGGTAATKAENDEEEEKKRIEARREKQRRRREKNSEKYGDGRMAYTCSFCKFRSFEEKDIVEHLDSETHQATLDHIQKQTKFEKVVMEFLHACMVNKYKKTSLRKVQAQTPQNEDGKPQEKDVMEGVTPEDHMIKVDTVHCSPCNAYIPALPSSVQQHLRSADHTKNKREYKEQIKRESVLTATSILNNPIVKTRFEMFAKGENPFENPEQTEQQADGEAQADADGEGEAEEADGEALEEGDGEEDEGGEAAANDVDQFTTDDVDQSFEN